MTRRQERPRADVNIADAIRLYEQMWSIERIARLFDFDYDTMRRLIARHATRRPHTRHSE